MKKSNFIFGDDFHFIRKIKKLAFHFFEYNVVYFKRMTLSQSTSKKDNLKAGVVGFESTVHSKISTKRNK